jgi:hypothetical protein
LAQFGAGVPQTKTKQSEITMRVRVGAQISQAIERLARAESRSCQSMTTRLIMKGMVAEGHAVLPPIAIDDLKDPARVSLPLPAEMRTAIKRLARADDRSNRSMMHQILHAGLRTYEQATAAAPARS